MHVREPLVSPVDISELRPTQITVGMHEVRAKRESWQARKDKSEFLGRHLALLDHNDDSQPPALAPAELIARSAKPSPLRS